MGIPPLKHVVDSGTVSVASAAQTIFNIATGVLNPDYISNPTNVRAASIIRKVHLQIDLVRYPLAVDAGGNANYFDMYVGFNINNNQVMPIAGSTGNSKINNQIFWEEGCLITYPKTEADLTEVWHKVWRVDISIPQAWSKIMDGDTLNLYFKSSIADGYFLKIKAIYKEIYP